MNSFSPASGTTAGKRVDLALKLLFVFLPLLMLLLICFWKGFDILGAEPCWNDEVFWYEQAKSFIEYGRPLGYFGYNQTHSAVGTFAAWGPWLVCLMSIFPALFHLFGMPVTVFSFILGNIAFMMAAHALFLVLVKPDRRRLLWLLLAAGILFSSWLYIFTVMAEVLRYSLAIILAGLFVYALDTDNQSRVYPLVLYGVLPLVLSFFTLIHLMFTLLFPIWFYILWKRNRARMQGRQILWALGAGIFWVVLTLVLAKIYFFAAAPYPDYTIQEQLAALTQGIGPALSALLTPLIRAWENAGVGTLVGIILEGPQASFFIAAYILFYYAVLLYLLVSALLDLRRRDYSGAERDIICLFVLAAFLGLVYLVYIQDLVLTLLRHLSIPLVFCLYFLAASKRGKANCLPIFLLISGVLLLYPFSVELDNTFLLGRDDPSLRETRAEYLEMYSQHISPDPDASPWESTVVIYRDCPSYCSNFPTGVGINLIFNLQINTTARYAILCKSIMPDVLEEFSAELEQTHTLLYEDDNILFYRRN